ncbi:uncharacterized protein LOC141784487 [Halichoeres trimaculatus]|uniref:uncharacterized protein LOC141784487 n=1 Tax=Halichoeres trimaculatus TaxID=147232 RepID=UPI003D9F697D
MRLIVVLGFVLASCLAQKPQPCKSPPLLSGALTVSTQNEEMWVYAKFLYDALGQRLRLFEVASSENKTFTSDILVLYREHVMYQIFDNNRTCTVSPVEADFVPFGIPDGAFLLGQVVLGSSTGPGQGLLVNSWMGAVPGVGGKYMSTVTEFGCIPVSLAVQTKEFGWVLFSYFNNVIGISDPGLLNPPSFCPGSDAAADQETVNLLSLLHKNIKGAPETDESNPLSRMRLFVLLVCLTAGCLAGRPQQCTSPPLMSGALSVSTASEKLLAFAKYTYDALGQRIRLREFGFYNNKTFHLDMLLLYKQGVVYKINPKNRTCCKKTLCTEFHPLEVPKNSTLLGQAVLGSSSGPGQGLLVNTWAGEMQLKRGKAKYMSTVTEFGCIPVSSLFHTERTGWMITSFYNNVIGITDPQLLIPPSFCQDAQLEEEEEEEPVNFYNLF